MGRARRRGDAATRLWRGGPPFRLCRMLSVRKHPLVERQRAIPFRTRGGLPQQVVNLADAIRIRIANGKRAQKLRTGRARLLRRSEGGLLGVYLECQINGDEYAECRQLPEPGHVAKGLEPSAHIRPSYAS